MRKNRMTELEALIERESHSIEYQEAAFELDVSAAFCERLIGMGYGHDTSELVNGRPFFQISTEEIPDIPGISKKTIKRFMEGDLSKVSSSELFRILWEVGVVLEPHNFMGQGIYDKEYGYSIEPK